MTRLETLVALAGRRPVSSNVTVNTATQWYRISNADAPAAQVHVYDAIGGFGLGAAQFVQDLAGITSKSIDLHINSPGGDVFDAIAMHAALVNHPATVNTYVDGVAASAASFLAMAGDTIGIEKPAKMMIHDASGLTLGNEADHRQMADLLGQISDTIAGMYADRAGGTVADWRDAMRAETWYSAPQAVAAGLADRVLNDTATPEDRRSQLIRARARVTLRGK
jgi:ATP-dependent protease ClpP protease subunit